MCGDISIEQRLYELITKMANGCNGGVELTLIKQQLQSIQDWVNAFNYNTTIPNAAQILTTVPVASFPQGTSVQEILLFLNNKINTIHAAAVLTSNEAPFTWNTNFQTGNIPRPAYITDLGGGELEFNSGDGSTPFVFTTGGGTGNTDLGIANRTSTTLDVTSSTGNDATLPSASNTEAGLMSAADKFKLSGIAAGAEVNVNADWNAVSGDAQILNKPNIPSVTGLASISYVDAQDNTKQNNIQYQEEGSNLGAAGTVNTVNFTGAAVTASRTGNVLTVDVTASGGGGEANTASNVGVSGVGVFKQKTGTNLEFKNINSGSNKVTVTNDAANSEIDVDVVVANLTGIAQSQVTNLETDLAGKHPAMQFQDEGSNLGSSGTITTINYTGTAINTSRVGNVVTVNVDATAGVTNLSVGNRTATTLDVISDTGTDATLPFATTSLAGLLTSADKTKLDGIATGANLYTHPNHSGDVVSVADGATTIATNVVSNTKLAQAPTLTLKGNNTGGTANVADLTASQVKTMLAIAGSDVSNTPSGSIASTTVQTALNELDGEKHTNIQFQNEGTNLSTAGTVDVINFTGAAINAARVGNTVTVDVSATSGVTNLGYTASSTNGIVTSDTGTDATIPLVTGTDAGLLAPADFTKLGFITITQAVNLDTLESDTATNNAKVTNATHTGDATGATVLTLATVNTNIGTFGTGTQVPQFTVNAKGLVTGVTNVTITPAASSITGAAALTKVDDTNVTLTLGGSPTTSLLAATSLTLGWTGTLSTTRGGTGLSTLGTANQQLRVNAGGTALEYFTPVTSGGITSLNGLTGAVQTFTNDTNISIVSGGTAHVITWNGTLADNRITSSANWNTAFNNRITSLTTTGNSGAATLISNVLNIPNYTLVGLGGQPLDADLTAIAALAGTSGILRKTATDTWTLDTNAYLTANQTITLSGEATGSGTTSIPVTLSNSAVIGKVLTGFTSSTGTILPTDSILQAIQKLNGNLAAATAGGISSVSGTTNRITSTGGTNPVIDISASYVGQTSLTTLGTITTGVWNGTAITDTYISSASTWNSKQAGVQYKDEGIALGTTATVTEINFTGNGISASRTGNIVTVNVGATAGVTNLTYTSSATDGIVVSDTGSDATIPAASGTIAGLMIPAQFTKLSNITVTQAVDLDALEQDVADLTTLSGVASNALTLGTFTGITIPDSSTIKAAIQSLETALESATISDPTNNIRVVSVNTTLSATTDGTVVFDTAGTVATLPSPTNKLMLVVKNVSGGNMTVTGHLDGVAAQTFTIASLESYKFHSNGSTFYII